MTASDRFAVPAECAGAELLIKRSRFVAAIDFVADRNDFQAFLKRRQAQFPDARHHCWAYIAGAPGDLRRADKSDDGEPRGTAGRPILNVLEHSGVGYIAAVVTRYFGGVKLGAGGLVRAYGQCAGAALAALTTRTYLLTDTLQIALPYALLGSVEHWLGDTQIRVSDKRFADDVCLTLEVPRAQVDDVRQTLATLGGGQISLPDPD